MTTATLAGLVLIGGFVLLLLMRVPISFAMLLATLGSALAVSYTHLYSAALASRRGSKKQTREDFNMKKLLALALCALTLVFACAAAMADASITFQMLSLIHI